jgi:hypothetical protein
MNHDDLARLADGIENASAGDPDAVRDMLAGLKAAFAEHAAARSIDAAVLVSGDAALDLIQSVLPDWTVSLKGKAHLPDGHWTCTLRESTSRDDDELLGVGKGRTPPLAMTAALLRVAARRAKGYR